MGVSRRYLLLHLGAAGLVGRLSSAAAATASLQVTQPALGVLPQVPLRTMDGRARMLGDELSSPVPLVLNFVFTTCSSTCSAQTAMLVEVQKALQARGRALHVASITIDPDNDTPEQLQQFARRFGIGQRWQFYTGRFDDLLRVQRHFDVYRGSKAAHPPVLLLRRAASAPWVRVEGFPTPRQLLALIDTLPAKG